MARAGKTTPLTFVGYDIEMAIKERNLAPFRPSEIITATSAKSSTVIDHLNTLVREGLVDHLKRGLYQQKRTLERPKRRLPHSFVAERLWQVLCEQEMPLSFSALVELTEEKAGCKESLYHAVSRLLVIWHRVDALERFGKKGEYKYLRKPDIQERPVAPANYPR